MSVGVELNQWRRQVKSVSCQMSVECQVRSYDPSWVSSASVQWSVRQWSVRQWSVWSVRCCRQLAHGGWCPADHFDVQFTVTMRTWCFSSSHRPHFTRLISYVGNHTVALCTATPKIVLNIELIIIIIIIIIIITGWWRGGDGMHTVNIKRQIFSNNLSLNETWTV